MRHPPALRLALAFGLLAVAGCQGEHQGPGTPSGARVAPEVVAQRHARQQDAAPPSSTTAPPAFDDAPQILFGDLHVHTTFSPDAYVMTLPVMGGTGTHPPADACDYARFCAGLDLWSINDHAEGLSPQHWQETIAAIQECNARVDPDSPDTAAFLGWEWSQVGATPETHFGHKNVVLRDYEDGKVPARPIAAPRPDFRVPLLPLGVRVALPLVYFSERQRYYDYFQYVEEVLAAPDCPHDVDVRDLPPDCHEVARDPRELFAKLDQWGFDSLVIPHGTAWGLMTPPRSNWNLQRGDQHDSQRQNLIEVYSGHGNSEEYRAWRAIDEGLACPEPTPDYEPCCWRAGEIIRSRCEDPESAECRARVAQARADYAAGGAAAHNAVPGATVEDWGTCGQCEDCFAAAFNFRPGMSAQYAIASDFRFGFIGSSDTHSAAAGNGFKEHARRKLTESKGPIGRAGRFAAGSDDPTPESRRVVVDEVPLQRRRHTERGSSFLLTGGLAAVHAQGRGRDAIWDSLSTRNVYGTSGDRILLWFDLLNGPQGEAPMGADVEAMGEAPRFRVRAGGAFHQKPGCPSHVVDALGPERVTTLCLDECYHPADTRKAITRIEIVRIRMGDASADDAATRIEDPWRVIECPAGIEACVAEFDDPSFGGAEPMAYYVRAIQEPTLAVNGGRLRCETNDAGECVRVRPCYGDERTPLDDDCLGEIEERAWSSPIFLTPAPSSASPSMSSSLSSSATPAS